VIAVVSVLLIVATVACTSVEEQSEVILAVEMNSPSYAQNSPITVTATVLVLDDSEVGIAYGNPLRDFDFALVDEQSRILKLTEEAAILGGARAPRISHTVTQDNPWQQSFRIDTWFELSSPGTYTLTLKRYAWTPSATLELEGDPATFTRLP
jgi:hypothetical protein